MAVAGVSWTRSSRRREPRACMYRRRHPPHPPLYLLTHTVSFLPLATRYTCYSGSANTPRCSPYSINTITRTSAAFTSTLIPMGLYPTSISDCGDGDAEDFGNRLPDDTGSDLDDSDLNGSNSNGSNLSPPPPPVTIGGVKESFFELRPCSLSQFDRCVCVVNFSAQRLRSMLFTFVVRVL